MNTSEETKRKLVDALLRLNNISKNKAALAISLQRQNLYAWFKGVDTAVSNTKKLELLALLGVSAGQLANDRIHRWCIQNLEDVQFVISTLTAAESAPQELFVLGIWPANDTDAVLRLTTNDHHHVYILLHYPTSDTPHTKISAETLGIGTQMKSIVAVNKEQWAQWLKPDEIEPGLIARTIDFEIQYNLPYEPLDTESDEDGVDIDYDAPPLLEPPTATQEQVKRWVELLDQGLMTGRTYEQIEAETKRAMSLYSFRELRAMQNESS